MVLVLSNLLGTIGLYVRRGVVWTGDHPWLARTDCQLSVLFKSLGVRIRIELPLISDFAIYNVCRN